MVSTSLYKLSVKQHLALLGYSALVWSLLPVLFIRQLLKGVRKDPKWAQRFGVLPDKLPTGGWLIHCVSVGEVTAAAGLIKAILKRQPELPIVITTTTDTGAEQVNSLLGDRVRHCYLPYDTGWAMNRLLRRLAPKRVVIMEVELWPNMMRQCGLRQIPVYLVNARMTERSAARYQSFGALFQPMLQGLSRICAQGERDAIQYRNLGASEDQLVDTGNMKFDIAIPHQAKEQRADLRRRWAIENRLVIIGGSTHDPEEMTLLRTYRALRKNWPQLLLVLVPRHPQRFDSVADLCEKQGVNLIRLSQNTPCTSETEVLLADQMGKLNQLYLLADLAFVGGSLADRGGHNALEPAACGLPIIMGPNQYNNPMICQALEDVGALCSVEDAAELQRQIRDCLLNPNLRQQSGRAGLRAIERNSGAIEKTLAVLFG
ncbi:Lipid IV(A) 3-deoxy-D-manno-octulosonic acid transferase [Saliniradius amylolyticus]|uniref:3-deoxy-D-manno-octulosonic acid transferase n=1 Tax=Saliniradius amylolyticus TaxID=2183582 RepID=A0A2S2DYT1_9ALTE|nr:lipid IV(A) 3-deoxy-D-manno-octulosonic acid transferase [Saliniradius amylolyticus]AWL10555.1 Lipid IV(A) 3-deoxy-D-manno-octulosonic acid transferase [Saliniradius amylolyticus]